MTQELLMQRCVDGELTSDQRRKLLEQLEQQPETWKELACLYMEEQLFAKAVNDDLQQVRSVTQGSSPIKMAAVASPAVSDGRWKRWFAHPVTSVALCLCVAFLSGMLLRDNSGSAMTASSSIQSSDSIPYRLTSANSDEFPRAMKNALNELGYNQTESSKRAQATSSTYEDRNGRRYLRLIPRDGSGIMVPIDAIQVVFP